MLLVSADGAVKFPTAPRPPSNVHPNAKEIPALPALSVAARHALHFAQRPATRELARRVLAGETSLAPTLAGHLVAAGNRGTAALVADGFCRSMWHAREPVAAWVTELAVEAETFVNEALAAA